jgi:predicted secreted protein
VTVDLPTALGNSNTEWMRPSEGIVIHKVKNRRFSLSLEKRPAAGYKYRLTTSNCQFLWATTFF